MEEDASTEVLPVLERDIPDDALLASLPDELDDDYVDERFKEGEAIHAALGELKPPCLAASSASARSGGF